MADSTDLIPPMLREMRAENEDRHGEVLGRFELIEHRLKSLEAAQASIKQVLRSVRELEGHP